MDDVHTALLYRAHIEGVGIDELHNEHAEDILITQLHRSADGGHAAKQLTQTAGARLRRMIRGKEFKDAVAHCGILLINYRVSTALDQHFRID